MLKKMIKKGRKIMKDMVKNEAEVIEAKKEVLKDLTNYIIGDQNVSELVGSVLIGGACLFGIAGIEFLRLSQRAAQNRKENALC